MFARQVFELLAPERREQMQTRDVAVGFHAAPLHGVPYGILVLREELQYRYVRRGVLAVGFLTVRSSLREPVGGLLAGAPIDAASLSAYPDPRFPSSVRPLTLATTLAVAILPRHKQPPMVCGSVRLGSNAGVKPTRWRE